MAADLGQQTVEFSSLARRAAEDSYLALKELVDRSKKPDEQRSDSEKKIDLLKFIAKTRQRMLRLHVLAKWCQQVPLVHYCQQLASTLSSHDTCFTQTADSLFYMHEGLQQARAPIFDVPSAIEVFLTGNYQRLPKCISDIGIQGALMDDEQKLALKKLDALVGSKLLEVSLPKEISDVKVTNGTAVLRVDGEFKVVLTLGYRGHLSLWRILHLDLLVGEKGKIMKLEESRRYVLGDDLERRMAVAENPFVILYTILHELCVSLVMDTVVRQVQVLRQGRWKDAIRFELTSDGSGGLSGTTNTSQQVQDDLDSSSLKIPGLKIIYWLDIDKNTGASDFSSFPYVKIELGQDSQIKYLHNSFLLDPHCNKEARFSLDQSCIDVEKLLLRVIACNRHTRLLEIQRELSKNAQIFQNSDDAILSHERIGVETDSQKDEENNLDDNCVDEVLRVRAFGPSFITLGINIRNGRFVLQSSKNILAPSTLSNCEEALNQRSLTATDVFTMLRSKSILNLFASTGRFLSFQVYDQTLTNLKIPKAIMHGSDFLLMGFPQCGNSYYLLMQVDKDFKPVFSLLESKPASDDKSHSLSDANHALRINKIDISQMKVIADELNLSLFDWEKLRSLPNTEFQDHIAEHGLSSFTSQLPGNSRSSFSSIVDEVFEFDKGPSGDFSRSGHQSSPYKMPALSCVSYHPISYQEPNPGIISVNLEGGLKQSQESNLSKFTSGFMSSSSAAYSANNLNGLNHNSSTTSLSSSSPIQNASLHTLSTSKSDQDLSTPNPRHKIEAGQLSTADEHQVTSTSELPRQLSVDNGNQPIATLQSTNPYIIRSQLTGNLFGLSKMTKSVSAMEKKPRRRSLTDFLNVIPSFQVSKGGFERSKRRKLSDLSYTSSANLLLSQTSTCRAGEFTYGNILCEANHGITSANVFVSILLHVFRHGLLCIKHAQLTSQMDIIGIPYVEEVGSQTPSSNLWIRLPFSRDISWGRICLRLGKPGCMFWDVKIEDPHFNELWELHKESTNTAWGDGVRIANTSENDSHIHFDADGVVLSYKSVEPDSIQRLVSDLGRLYNARLFACGMRKLVGVRADDKIVEGNTITESKLQPVTKGTSEVADKLSEQIRKTFKIEAVGLMSLWFSYASLPSLVHFVVEWEAGKKGCTMHVSHDQLWPHTKFLEDYVNGGEVASFLDCIRLTAGPLLALCGAIRPARIPAPVSAGHSPIPKQNNVVQPQGLLPNTSLNVLQPSSNASASAAVMAHLGNQSLHPAAMLSAAGRGGPGLVPSSLLPFDVSVVLRGPYWIRIIYRKKFAVDMRCFAGDQVWLQPATPPKGGPAAGGSLPCPQFRPFIMEHVAQGLNALEPNFSGASHVGGQLSSSNINPSAGSQQLAVAATRPNITTSAAISRPNTIVGSQAGGGSSRANSVMLASSGLAPGISGLPIRISPSTGFPVHVKGELNTAFIGLGDDGGYGGGWVPLAALKKVLRGILKYLGVLWLFAQLPDLLKEILGSILKENEGALLNLDQEQPALRFFVGGYVFAVSVHRVQLLLQVLSVKRFHHQQQQQHQQQQNQVNAQEELTPTEINEICDYFSRRVASEPYDASRVASFITLLTLPVSVLREFLKLIAWKKGLSQAHGGDIATAQRARIELCLENHSGSIMDENSEASSGSKSNIHHDRAHNAVEFSLTFVLDPVNIPHMNAAGGAAWLPYCVSVKLKYLFGENNIISFLGMEGSHGGRACWLRLEDWEKCKQRMMRTAEFTTGSPASDVSQGRLRLVAEALQRTLQVSLQQLRDGLLTSSTNGS